MRYLIILLALVAQGAPAVEPERGLIAWWPDATAVSVGLLKQVGVQALITEVTTPVGPLAVAASEAGMAILAEVPAEVGAVANAKALGFAGVAVNAGDDEAALRGLLKAQAGYVAIVYLKPEQIGWDVSPALAVLRGGVWPGIASQGASVASASEGIWLDANSSLVGYLRAVFPKRPAVLGYRPDKDGGVPATRSVPPRSVEVSLADAFAAGGHVILSIPDDYRAALGKGETRALTAWKSLADVAGFLQKQRAMVRHEGYSRVGVLAGDLEQSGEVLNLAFRRNLSPVVVPLKSVPPVSLDRFDVVAAANVPLGLPAIEELTSFVRRGGTVLAAPAPEDEKNPPWWTKVGGKKVESAEDRDVYTLGKGRIYGYHGAVLDPGPFALDLKDAAADMAPREDGIKNLDFRIWSADSVLGVLYRVGPMRMALVLTSYGNFLTHDFLISVRGRYREATIVDASTPDQLGGAASPLVLMPRTGRVEFNLKQLARTAIILLEEQKP